MFGKGLFSKNLISCYNVLNLEKCLVSKQNFLNNKSFSGVIQQNYINVDAKNFNNIKKVESNLLTTFGKINGFSRSYNNIYGKSEQKICKDGTQLTIKTKVIAKKGRVPNSCEECPHKGVAGDLRQQPHMVYKAAVHQARNLRAVYQPYIKPTKYVPESERQKVFIDPCKIKQPVQCPFPKECDEENEE